MAIDQKNDKELMQHAFDDWYLSEKIDYEAFALKYPMNGELHSQNEKLKSMQEWCTAMRIEATPTFFLNGYQLPRIYSLEDLKYLVRAEF